MANEKRLDLIDRNALKAALEKYQNEIWDYEDLLLFFGNEIPSVDAVEVVHCKDCKKWEYDENFSGWCVEWRRRTLGDHFCSYGERREDNV